MKRQRVHSQNPATTKSFVSVFSSRPNNQNKENNDDNDNDDCNNDYENRRQIQIEQGKNEEMRSYIVNKLRPFQKEAYDFATKGIPIRNRATITTTDPKKKTTKDVTTNMDQQHYNASSSSCSSSSSPLAVGQGRILLADEMGLGKTVTSLAIMTHYKDQWPLLILCPASLRHTWPNEIETFLPQLSPQSVYVVSGYDDVGFAEEEEQEEEDNTDKAGKTRMVVRSIRGHRGRGRRRRPDIVVCSYGLLQTRSAAARALQQLRFQCVICDESHFLKQPKSQRTKLALPLLTQAQRLVLISGTPALARPVELWTQLSALQATTHFFAKTYTDYTQKYCNARRGRFGWDVSGVSNANELHSKLRKVMVRRLKSQVLTELPPKQRTMVPIAITQTQHKKECQSLMNDLNQSRQSVAELLDDNNTEGAFGARSEARRLLMEAYQATGIAKAPGVVAYLLDWLRSSSPNQKVLVFAHHKAVLDTIEVAIAKEFKGTGHIRIDGSVNSGDRARLVRKFQTATQIRVAILSMTAAGVGLTLTAASTVMFAELQWTPGVLAQAEDRCHRIGQQSKSVNVLYFVCKDTSMSVDSQLWHVLGRKVGTLGRVVDGHAKASWNAQTAKDPAINTNNKSQSGQDELQSFFANADPSKKDKSRTVSVPVKGTIMSFFQKQNTAAAASKNQSTTSSLSRKKTKITTDNNHNHNLNHNNSGEERKKIEWNCRLCTFRNVRPSKSRSLACEMCNTSYSPIDATSSSSTTSLTVDGIGNGNAGIPTRQEPTAIITPETAFKKAPLIAKASPTTSPSWPLQRAANDVVIIDEDGHDDDCRDVSNNATQSSSTSELMEGDQTILLLDDMDENDNQPSKAMTASDLIVIDDDEGNDKHSAAGSNNSTLLKRKVASAVTREKTRTPLLSFSVSKNSGRVTIHYHDSGKSSLTNFELEEIVTNETADHWMESKTNRRGREGFNVQFDLRALRKIVDNLDSRGIRNGCRNLGTVEERCQQEIQEFVSNYVGLREVEKKALKDSGRPFPGPHLKQAMARLLTASISTAGMNAITERYIGGAKERARENLENGTANSMDMAVLQGLLCAWCGGNLPAVSKIAGVVSTYCSGNCAEQGRLKRGGMFASTNIRSQLFALEGGVCQLCGIDAHALFTRIGSLHPAERLNALCNAGWKLPKTPKALERLLQDPKEGDFWQADHIVAVAEGGGGCGLENLRTLCGTCHSNETERLRTRLKTKNILLNDLSSSSLSKQRDIRSMFEPKLASSKNGKHLKK